MSVVEQTIEIAAPPNEVFVFFVPQRMPYWYGAEMDCHLEVLGGESDFGAAQKVRVSGHFKGWLAKKEVSHTAVIVRYETPDVLEWRFEDAYGVRGLERWELEPTPSGTRVAMRSEYEMPGRAARIADWLITRHAVARRNRDYLARLKKLAERR
ncbi:MAG TPA: SRPBCC family protein [Candidatus Acidoferrales bacterium]|jgi:uncharacterized protein YndB with AHSA1/START domain|nr:SRPBCC family protein [Candidatus Acidoferrales bacterium]